MTEYRQIEIDCDCGNHLSATVDDLPFDLTCIKCGMWFVEGINCVVGVKDHKAMIVVQK